MAKDALQLYHVTRHFFKSPGQHTLLTSDESHEESVKAKWAELQSLETDRATGFGSPRGPAIITDASMTSLTSSGSGTSSDSAATGSSSRNKFGSAKIKWKQVKKGSMRKLSSLTNKLSLGTNAMHSKSSRSPSNHPNVPNPGDVVSTAPDGWVSNVLPRIQASKSMQNLEQITRDSYYNLRGATATLKDKCNSFVELRQNQPSTQYDELWDEDSDGNEDLDRKQRVILQRIGLY